MNGFLISFYTAQSRQYEGQSIVDWLLAIAKQMDLRGATVMNASQGLDHRGQFHSAGFFELADQPVQIQFAVTEQQATALLDYLKTQDISLFYVKSPIEFGFIGTASVSD
ncbi:DUF190 domain-containing protein [Acinetobacter haemolyticus]|uniref:DUF190 domain-containing protein n=1 Tax=Acinetobacter haemolyticus TaxID=29430 RepID=A0A4V1ASZ9_ACIHA|nr:DUF190 domain-containing protein [Acinetobacter haemolyticus]QBQ17259.1 DUF190 domain-containing protein [Acinetobacter haemolyticus]